MNAIRIEKDSMGELEVPADALFGPQTQRAINNFPISHQTMPAQFIESLILLKQAAAQANGELGCITQEQSAAISDACATLLNLDDFMVHFPVDIFQTGSGTSSNMNANEVIANLASKNSGLDINPNDHVNFGQSSNDVIPSTIHISSAIALQNHLLPALKQLAHTIKIKAEKIKHHVKTGRTHLMDAMPVRMDQTLMAWHEQIENNIEHLQHVQSSLYALAQGGTAVGTGINTHEDFAKKFTEILSVLTDLTFRPANNLFAFIGSQDTIVSLSGQLKATAVTIIKIANDLRWMNSGPLAGLGEISLKALQPGSSIMPGKVNPVIPEAAAMVGAQVIGNDTAITIGGQSSNFELNVMLPMIAANVLSSIELLSNVSILLADNAISSFSVNEEAISEALHKNPILVTALNPIIGYAKAAEIAKQAYAQKRPIIDVAQEHTDLSREKLEAILDPKKLTEGGL